MWSRVAGDAMDLGLLGTAFASDRAQKGRVAAAAAAVAGVTLLDVICGGQLSRRQDGTGRRRGGGFAAWFGGAAGDRAIHVTKAITIGRPAQDLYRFWRDFQNLPRIMKHLDAVWVTENGRSHWRAKAPLGGTVEWDAEVTDDQPGRRIAWRSLPGADVSSAGSVSFEPASGRRGTIVRIELDYEPPGGAVGATFAKLFGRAPDQELQDDLRRFKQVMEVGEVVQSDATAKGWGAGQPPAGHPRR
jgi:uncharacterized membrane protein